MPLYEYECEACGNRFEVIRKFSDPPLTECPKCQGLVRKLFSSPAIQFKGTGWYITDYAKKSGSPGGSNSPGKSEKSESTGGESSTSSSSSEGSSESGASKETKESKDTKPTPPAKTA